MRWVAQLRTVDRSWDSMGQRSKWIRHSFPFVVSVFVGVRIVLEVDAFLGACLHRKYHTINCGGGILVLLWLGNSQRAVSV